VAKLSGVVIRSGWGHSPVVLVLVEIPIWQHWLLVAS